MYFKHSFVLKEKVEKEHQKVISMMGAKIPLGSLVTDCYMYWRSRGEHHGKEAFSVISIHKTIFYEE